MRHPSPLIQRSTSLVRETTLWRDVSDFIQFDKTLQWVGESNGTPLQSSCLENPMDGGAWWAAVHGVTKSQTRLSDFPFTFHFHALEKNMATHSSVLAWRIPGMGESGGLPSMGLHRVGHDWSDLAATVSYCRSAQCLLDLSWNEVSGNSEEDLNRKAFSRQTGSGRKFQIRRAVRAGHKPECVGHRAVLFSRNEWHFKFSRSHILKKQKEQWKLILMLYFM